MGEKKSWVHSPWTISITCVVLPIVLSGIFKDKPVFSTAWNCLRWCWNLIVSVLFYKIEIWIVFVAFAVVLFIIDKLLQKEETESSLPVFYDYNDNVFYQHKWTWEWRWNNYKNAWLISDLKILCPKCDTVMDSSYIGFTCPRCNVHVQSECDKNKVASLILDDVRRMQKNAKNKR